MSEKEPGRMDPHYDRSTLVSAALVFVGFGLLIYFLPAIMLALGGENPVLGGLAVAAILVLPFAGLWLRGRARRKQVRR